MTQFLITLMVGVKAFKIKVFTIILIIIEGIINSLDHIFFRNKVLNSRGFLHYQIFKLGELLSRFKILESVYISICYHVHYKLIVHDSLFF